MLRANLKIFLFFSCFIYSLLVFSDELKIFFWDLQPLSGRKTHISPIIRDISEEKPDILLLSGINNKEEMEKIASDFKGYNFVEIVNAYDRENHLAVISRNVPDKFKSVTDITYTIDDTEMPMQRGILDAVYNINGYKFHLIAADLKDRETHEKFNQTDMRRYEARQLRYYITEIITSSDDAPNVLLLGNLNDSCGKSPVKAVYYRRFGNAKQLFDLRPVDKMLTSWTFYDIESDKFERIDYAICSSGMIPEINLFKSRIFDEINTRKYGFAHRIIKISVFPLEQTAWNDSRIKAFFPNSIFAGIPKGKEIGIKEYKRKSPSQKKDKNKTKNQKIEKKK